MGHRSAQAGRRPGGVGSGFPWRRGAAVAWLRAARRSRGCAPRGGRVVARGAAVAWLRAARRSRGCAPRGGRVVARGAAVAWLRARGGRVVARGAAVAWLRAARRSRGCARRGGRVVARGAAVVNGSWGWAGAQRGWCDTRRWFRRLCRELHALTAEPALRNTPPSSGDVCSRVRALARVPRHTAFRTTGCVTLCGFAAPRSPAAVHRAPARRAGPRNLAAPRLARGTSPRRASTRLAAPRLASPTRPARIGAARRTGTARAHRSSRPAPGRRLR